MPTYAERREIRQDRLDGRADRLTAEATRRFDAAHAIVERIPFGQPILVGHHSEGRHRADIKRIDANMRAGIEAQKAAAAIPSAPHGGLRPDQRWRAAMVRLRDVGRRREAGGTVCHKDAAGLTRSLSQRGRQVRRPTRKPTTQPREFTT